MYNNSFKFLFMLQLQKTKTLSYRRAYPVMSTTASTKRIPIMDLSMTSLEIGINKKYTSPGACLVSCLFQLVIVKNSFLIPDNSKVSFYIFIEMHHVFR